MTKWSDFIRAPGTAGPPTVQGVKALGFALLSEVVTTLGKYVRVDQAQAFTNGEKTQGRDNLGLGTMATQAANLVAITGGSIAGITDLAIVDGGTGASTAAAARDNLGLGNVDNTSDANKPISTATQAALNLKVNTSAFQTSVTDFVNGMTLSNNVLDAANDINISAGSAKGGALAGTSSSAFGKRLDALWVAGGTPTVTAGGLDTGTKAANSTYRIWPLLNNTTGDIDFIMSLSLTPGGVNVPSGFSVIAPAGRDIGAIVTNSGGTIVPFIQDKNDFYWNALYTSLPTDLSIAATRAKAALSITVPTGRRVEAVLQAVIYGMNGDADAVLIVADGANTNIEKISKIYVSTGVKATGDVIYQYTNETAQVNLGLTLSPSPAGTNSIIKTLGWTDYTIPRI